MLIPRTIHQTFRSANDLPVPLVNNTRHLQATNPGWSYRFYDDQAMLGYVSRHFDARVLRLFLRINPWYGAARADLFRYLLLYREGGVYLDIKSSVDGPLDQMIASDDVYWLSQWANKPGQAFEGWGLHPPLAGVAGGEFQQWFIVAAPRHPFLQAVIERVLKNIESYEELEHGIGKRGVLNITGPVPYTLAIAPLLAQFRHRRIDTDAVGLRYSILGDLNPRAHEQAWTGHYSANREPVILPDAEQPLGSVHQTPKLVFSDIYAKQRWGRSAVPEDLYFSGTGSRAQNIVAPYVKAVSQFLMYFAWFKQRKANVVDLGCGDFAVGQQLRSACQNYVACDVVPGLIEHNRTKFAGQGVDFCTLDMVTDDLPTGDVAFVRQVLQHLPNAMIAAIVPKLVQHYTYLILSEHIPADDAFTPNLDLPIGSNIRLLHNRSGVVLTASPFNMPFEKCVHLCSVPEHGGQIRTTLYELKRAS